MNFLIHSKMKKKKNSFHERKKIKIFKFFFLIFSSLINKFQHSSI